MLGGGGAGPAEEELASIGSGWIRQRGGRKELSRGVPEWISTPHGGPVSSEGEGEEDAGDGGELRGGDGRASVGGGRGGGLAARLCAARVARVP